MFSEVTRKAKIFNFSGVKNLKGKTYLNYSYWLAVILFFEIFHIQEKLSCGDMIIITCEKLFIAVKYYNMSHEVHYRKTICHD